MARRGRPSKATDEHIDLMVQWLATPKDERDPPTTAEFANTYLGVTPQTMWNWSRKPEVAQRIREASISRARRRFPDVLKAMCEQAADGSYRHQDLFLRFVMSWNPAMRVDSTHVGLMVKTISASDQEEIVKALGMPESAMDFEPPRKGGLLSS